MLKEIEIRNFKRIRDEPLILKDLARVNYLVGENRSGKSSVLEFIGTIFSFNFKAMGNNQTYSTENDSGEIFEYRHLFLDDKTYGNFQFSKDTKR